MKGLQTINGFLTSHRAVSFHPVPRAMARVVFFVQKKIDEKFQSNQFNAIFLVSNLITKL